MSRPATRAAGRFRANATGRLRGVGRLPADPRDGGARRRVRDALVRRVAAARTASARTAAKQAPYESGIVPEHEPAERFPVKFYLVAMSFIVLDVEIVFLYPFATVFRGLGLFGLVAMSVFVLVLADPVRVPAVGRRARLGTGEGRRATHARSAAAHQASRARPERATAPRKRRPDGSRPGSRTTSSPRASKMSCAGAGATPCSPRRSASRVARSR